MLRGGAHSVTGSVRRSGSVTCIKGVVAGAGNGGKVRRLLMGKLSRFCRGKRGRAAFDSKMVEVERF